jgi:hypothetical protein
MNFNATQNPYGTRGAQDRQIIALSEGWAYYREWVLNNNINRVRILAGTVDPGNINWNHEFPRYYMGMFQELLNIGCTRQNIEWALSSDTFLDFHTRLVQRHPNLQGQINTIVTRYEAHINFSIIR